MLQHSHNHVPYSKQLLLIPYQCNETKVNFAHLKRILQLSYPIIEMHSMDIVTTMKSTSCVQKLGKLGGFFLVNFGKWRDIMLFGGKFLQSEGKFPFFA